MGDLDTFFLFVHRSSRNGHTHAKKISFTNCRTNNKDIFIDILNSICLNISYLNCDIETNTTAIVEIVQSTVGVFFYVIRQFNGSNDLRYNHGSCLNQAFVLS